jgi:uncharacterized protein
VRNPTRARDRAPARRPLLVAGLVLLAAGVAVLAVVLASAAGLGRGGGRAAAPAAQDPAGQGSGGRSPATATYRLEPGGGRAASTVRLEVAADPEARARGLMGRERVPPGTGMVFLYPADVQESFWMKDTLVPLSIAFVAGDGRVVSVTEMTPCRADPCPSYPPAGPYRYAVELAAGAFPAAGVGPGDRVVPEDPESLPEPS